jgi:hypothetical protein
MPTLDQYQVRYMHIVILVIVLFADVESADVNTLLLHIQDGNSKAAVKTAMGMPEKDLNDDSIRYMVGLLAVKEHEWDLAERLLVPLVGTPRHTKEVIEGLFQIYDAKRDDKRREEIYDGYCLSLKNRDVKTLGYESGLIVRTFMVGDMVCSIRKYPIPLGELKVIYNVHCSGEKPRVFAVSSNPEINTDLRSKGKILNTDEMYFLEEMIGENGTKFKRIAFQVCVNAPGIDWVNENISLVLSNSLKPMFEYDIK